MSSRKLIPTSVRMDDKTVAAFRDAARRENRSFAELIREATRAYVDRHVGFNKPKSPDENSAEASGGEGEASHP